MQKKSVFKLILVAVFIAFLSLAGCFFVDKVLQEQKNKVSQSAAAENSVVEVNTFADLKTKAEQGANKIKLTSNIDFSDTVYITKDVTIFADESFTLTRNQNFLGDMFIVGKDKNENNPILETGKAGKLTMSANNGATLTVDGNKGGVTDEVYGTVVMTVNTAEFNMNDGVIIQNNKKLGNVETLKHRGSHPEEIGGGAVIVVSGSFNMYGGKILNCQVREDESATKVSTKGGAVYSFGQFNMYGGKIEGCRAARGGAIFSYKIAKIFKGEILNNFASVYGGGIYKPNSQYTNLTVGDYSNETRVVFKGNTTEGSGGAIFTSLATSLFIPGATEFIGNSADSNGGAINSPGANVIKNTLFKGNTAGSKGGAIYVYHNKATSTVRHTVLNGVNFVENVATSGGGALGTGSSTSEYEYNGSTVYATNCNFSKNESKQGGAVYIIRQCYVELDSCNISENEATQYGGGIYITGKSTLIIKNIKANENNATSSGGFLYLTTGETVVKILSGEANDNTTASSKGSTIWTNATAVVLQIKGTTTKEYFTYNGEILGKGTVVEYEA